MVDAVPDEHRNKPGFLRMARTIGWALFGVRGRKGYESDLKLNPVHVILTGLLLVAVFIIVLLVIANLAAA